MSVGAFSALARGAIPALGLAAIVSTAAAAATPDPSLPPSLTVAAAIPDGQIDRAIGQLDELVADVLRRSGVPGMAVAVVRDGQTVYAKGFGVRRVGAPEPVDADTVFQLASVSKSVTATVVAREVSRHVVDWDTPIVRDLPWFALQDDWITRHVTIADMLAHRSGLPDHAGDDLEDIGYDRRQVLERLRFLPLHSFRDEYAYTNFGFTAAAAATAAAAGTDWASLSQQAIYAPLGMTSTSSRFADFERRPNRAVGHVKVADAYAPKYQRQPDAQSPAGGVSSSVRDMAHWMTMVLQGGAYGGSQIIAADALLPAVTGQIVSSHATDIAERSGLYGYGFNVGTLPSGRVTLSHSGGFALGAGTNYLLIPSAHIGIITLTNAEPIGAAEAVDAGFADLVQFGTVTRDWLAGYGRLMEPLNAPVGSLRAQAPPANPAPAAALAVYAGRYDNDYDGEAVVVVQGDRLVLQIGPAAMAFPLRHWDANVFVYTPTGENAPDGSLSAATFTVDAAGHASAVALEFLAASGKGNFVRRPD